MKVKAGIKGLKLLEENINDEIKLLGTINGRIWLQKKNDEIILSKNLIENGLLEFGNNTNFSQMDYEEGYLSKYHNPTNTNYYLYSDSFAEVDPNKKYLELVNMKTSATNTEYYVGFAEYDIDKRFIDAHHVMYIENSLTTLARDLKNGDTVIYLDNVSGFKVTESTPGHQRGFIFWNYKDSTRISISGVNVFEKCILGKWGVV